MCRSEIISACRTGEECTNVGVKVATVAGGSKFTGKVMFDDSVKVTDKGALSISGRCLAGTKSDGDEGDFHGKWLL